MPPSEATVHPPLPSPGQLQAGPPETPTRKGRSTHVPAIRGIQGWNSARKAPSRKDKVSCERFVHGRDYPEAFLHELAAFSVCVSSRSGNNQTTEAPGLPLQIQCDRITLKESNTKRQLSLICFPEFFYSSFWSRGQAGLTKLMLWQQSPMDPSSGLFIQKTIHICK